MLQGFQGVIAELFRQARAPLRPHDLAGLDGAAAFALARAAQKPGMTAMGFGQQREDAGILAMMPHAEDNTFILPVHGFGLKRFHIGSKQYAPRNHPGSYSAGIGSISTVIVSGLPSRRTR